MKTSDFYKAICNITDGAAMSKMFDYGIDKFRSFLFIKLSCEPNEEIKHMCQQYGYDIKEEEELYAPNKTRTYWGIIPTNGFDFEFEENPQAPRDEILKVSIRLNRVADVNQIVCRDRLITYSVVCNGEVSLFDNLRAAKLFAREECRKTHKHTTINCHTPFECWREYISVFYGPNRLKWFHLHVDALTVKNV